MELRLRKHLIRAMAAFCMVGSPALAETTQHLETAGLVAPVEILKDKWGISHIYAQNQADLFFAQGYSAARDRLFQFEIWRRRALGLMAEIQGEKALQHDIGARLLKFRGDMDAEMQHYHKDGKEIITSFVRGVNAYIEETRKNPDLLPVEFQLLGITPGYWTPEVVISRHNALTGGASQEVMLSALVDMTGPDATEALFPFTEKAYLKAFDGVDLSDIRNNLMDLYTASRTPPAFDKDDLAANNITDSSAVNFASLNNHNQSPPNVMEEMNTIGSNNWLIAGSKTKSGFPIMANDPHRSITMPSLRYWAHLVAPGWNVIGGGEPVLPGISIGHNEYGAWGLTIFRIDQEDLYVYETNPENPNEYRYEGKWEAMETVSETIPVRGAAPVTVTLKYTRHGPVLMEKTEGHKAFALRAAWLETGTAPYLASLRMDQADSWQAFREACSYSGLPGENMIWADKEGNIGWQTVGIAPLRVGWNGLLPVTGDGRYEWAGFAPIKSMPHMLNPENGYFQTANQVNVPEGYPNIYSPLGADPFRFDRIGELLASRNDMTIEDSKTIQFDELAIPARILVPLFKSIQLNDPKAEEARQMLLAWDYRMSANSVAANIYAAFENALRTAMRNSLVPEEAYPYLTSLPLTQVVKWATAPETAPDGLFSGKAEAARDTLLTSSLKSAVNTLTEKLGPDTTQWQYGNEKQHYSKIMHPLSKIVPELADKFDVGGDPKGGSSSTVNLSVGSPYHIAGPSLRIIADTSDWDKTVGTNTPGQSGNPDSPFYDNLYEGWLNGDYFPAYYSREKIEASTQEKILLKPE
ncbi:penicillin acylase family protein [Kordiimonas pumila]|uniref:Penicillin acylase family protein n=1 Tax=Kordiimonas pumila TaxID=2161677 RepID=A0ABV7D052_9PROT|nr:penicillin acylase family protein [Kordiimonas pumila]